ncbi:hypothetical protein QJS66_07485 [Kocuria rhizophila]|nr:hypothetical protein QJS66_07485 [Kocuria rhizophila]
MTALAIPVLLGCSPFGASSPHAAGPATRSTWARVPPLPHPARGRRRRGVAPVGPGTATASAPATEGPATEPGGPQPADDEPQDYERLPIPYAGLATTTARW